MIYTFKYFKCFFLLFSSSSVLSVLLQFNLIIYWKYPQLTKKAYAWSVVICNNENKELSFLKIAEHAISNVESEQWNNLFLTQYSCHLCN